VTCCSATFRDGDAAKQINEETKTNKARIWKRNETITQWTKGRVADSGTARSATGRLGTGYS